MNDIRLYHKDIYMPAEIIGHVWKLNMNQIEVSRHAHFKAQDRNIVISYSDLLYFEGNQVVEAELSDGVVTKIVVRKSYGLSHDICYVLRWDMQKSRLILITVWLNAKLDDHSTLDASKYEKE